MAPIQVRAPSTTKMIGHAWRMNFRIFMLGRAAVSLAYVSSSVGSVVAV